ncbi:MAG: hypothetical protein IPF46_00015 [Saprospiraceae bacterium]|nr:hypothetical protein [Candidatus Vicinibacter affinis]
MKRENWQRSCTINWEIEIVSLNSYKETWREKNSNPKTVVLIAGSGGRFPRRILVRNKPGSYLCYSLGDTAKIFAISTISGQYFRANMFLTCLVADPKSLSVKEIKSFWDTIYSRNYLSGGIWGVLLGDGIGGVSMGKTDYDKDRNYYHEQGELSAIQSCFPPNDQNQIRKLMLGDYMTKWSDTTMKFRIPLHFVNPQLPRQARECCFSCGSDSTTASGCSRSVQGIQDEHPK